MPPRLLLYRWYARMYHFSPEVVDRLPLEALTWFPLIEEAEVAAQEIQQRQERRAQERGHRGY